MTQSSLRGNDFGWWLALHVNGPRRRASHQPSYYFTLPHSEDLVRSCYSLIQCTIKYKGTRFLLIIPVYPTIFLNGLLLRPYLYIFHMVTKMLKQVIVGSKLWSNNGG